MRCFAGSVWAWLGLLGAALAAAGCAGEVEGNESALDRGVTLPRDRAVDGNKTVDRGGPTVDKKAAPKPDQRKQVPDRGATGKVVPPLGGSSKGSGGQTSSSGVILNAGGVSYIVITPSGYNPGSRVSAMIVISGTERASTMAQNLRGAGPYAGLSNTLFAVIDGPNTYGNGAAAAKVLDDVRSKYNVDNDRTYLLSESAGTRAGLQLGFDLRQSYFAAFWANDVNASATPKKTAATLGFAPWGNAGPGGQVATATAIVSGMKKAGYRTPADAPYSGTGAGQHGNPQQFIAALKFFVGKSRR